MSPEVQVRTITPAELLDWVECMNVAFHGDRPAQEVADWRVNVLGQDYARSIAAMEGARVVGTYESFAAELTLPGGVTLPADAISAVSVLPSHHRRGLLRRMIDVDLRAARERGEVVGILMASEYPIYGRFGFGPATQRVDLTVHSTRARFTRAAVGSADEVTPARLREVAPELFDRFRRTRPGQIDRSGPMWDSLLGIRPFPWAPRDQLLRCATYASPAGELEGYLWYRSDESRGGGSFTSAIALQELVALSPDAYLGLWRYCCELDLLDEVRARMRSIDEPLPWLLENPRTTIEATRRTDFLWVRPLDVPRLLERRQYSACERLVIEVDDGLGFGNGRFALEVGPEGARCLPTDASPDLRMGISALGAISLGGVNLHVLAAAGRVDEERAGALERAERAFHWSITPWCSTFF